MFLNLFHFNFKSTGQTPVWGTRRRRYALMSKRTKKHGRCFACGTTGESARHGTRPNGSTWHLCQQCLDSFREERKVERETVEFLRARGSL
jgi:hypothetical protein